MNKRFALSISALLMVMLLSSGANALDVSGEITVNSWTINDSPVMVKGDLTLPKGVALTIDPGVWVVFDGDYAFNVHGLLRAVGTATDSIVFTSIDPDSAELHWRGIRFTDTNAEDSNSRLEFCRIEYGWARGDYPMSNGGAIYIEGSSPTLNRCTFTQNIAEGDGGAIYAIFTRATIQNSLLYSNKAGEFGGAMFIAYAAPSIMNCTVSLDSAAKWGGGIFIGAEGEPFITNSIVAYNYQGLEGDDGNPLPNGDNFFPNIARIRSSNAEITYTCVPHPTSEFSGQGNTSVDPGFVNASAAPFDFHLKLSSACVDAGDPSVNPGGEPDFLVNRINLGCYGGTEEATLSLPVISIEEADSNLAFNYNNVRINSQVSRELLIENIGHYRLNVTDFKFTSPDFFPDSAEIDGEDGKIWVPSYESAPIDPGESGKFLINFRPSDIQSYADTVFFFSDDTITRVPFIRLNGTGIDPVAEFVEVVDFGAKPIGAVYQSNIYVKNVGRSTLRISDLNIQGRQFDADTVAGQSRIAPGDSGRVEIRFEPLLPEPYTATLSIENNDRSIVLELLGAGIGPSMEVLEDELFLGYVYFDGDTATYNVNIVNHGGGDWALVESDILAPIFLGQNLKNPPEALSTFLSNGLSSATQNLLSAWDGVSDVSLTLMSGMIEDINSILKADLIYAEGRFAHVALSDRILNILEEELMAGDTLRVNRLLLEAGYPTDIAKRELHISGAAVTTNAYSVDLPAGGIMVARNDTVSLPIKFHPPAAQAAVFEDSVVIASNYPESFSVDFTGYGMPQPGRYVFGDVKGTWSWDDGDAAIVVLESVKVPAHEQLIIEPGTQILLDPEAIFEVEGELRAVGTIDDSIYFMPRNLSGTADAMWDGLYLKYEDASRLEYCRIESAVNGLNISEAGPLVQFCTISNNGDAEEDGGGLFIENSGAVIKSSIIENNVANRGGGMFILNSKPTISNCEIRNNIATKGGGLFMHFQASATLFSNLIYKNNGGGIEMTNQTSPRIINNTIVDNQGNGLSASVRSVPILVNTIIWGNSSEAVDLDNGSNSLISYSDIEGGSTGNNNMQVEPLFVNPANNNYQLAAGSPLIDKGNTEKQYRDFYFPPSQGSERNDIGAYGGPYGGLWDRNEVSINIYKNAAFPQWIDIFVSSMDQFVSAPICSVQFDNTTWSKIILTGNPNDANVYAGTFEATGSGNVFITVNASLIGEGAVKVGREIEIVLAEVDEIASISAIGIDGNLEIKAGGLKQSTMLIAGSVDRAEQPKDGILFLSPSFYFHGLARNLSGDATVSVKVAEFGWTEDDLGHLQICQLDRNRWTILDGGYSNGMVVGKVDGGEYFSLAWIENPTQEERAAIPEKATLLSAYPNPFNQSITLEFDLDQSANVKFSIYDLNGRRVARLIDGELGTGLHRTKWNGANEHGESLSSGIYWARLEDGTSVRSVKILLLR